MDRIHLISGRYIDGEFIKKEDGYSHFHARIFPNVFTLIKIPDQGVEFIVPNIDVVEGKVDSNGMEMDDGPQVIMSSEPIVPPDNIVPFKREPK